MWRFLSINLLTSFLLIGCSQPNDHYQGYVDNKLRFISSNYAGILAQLKVNDGDPIKTGQALFTLEPYPEQMDIDEIKANIQSAQAKIQEYQTEVTIEQQKLERRAVLRKEQFAHEEELDNAKLAVATSVAKLADAKATLASYQAQLNKAQWQLKKKIVYANNNGYVNEVYYYEHELVPAEKPILALIDPSDTTLFFFVPESEISTLKIGQVLQVSCDGCNPFSAKVSYIAPKPEYTPPTIFSQEMRKKMSFLVKAKADYETNLNLHPGQPITVKRN